MNRIIKFRGKRLDNREWVEGTPVWSVNNRCYMIVWVEEYEQTDVLHEVEYAEVDPATVGQYTGLKDKDGREICEGDILQVAEYENIAILLNISKEDIEKANIEDCKDQKRYSFTGEVVFF